MTESVFHHPLPYKVTLGIPTPYKEVLHWMTVIPTKQTLGQFVLIG